MAEKLEKTCENCKYEYEDMEGTHCRHCIHNAEENFEKKENIADELEAELKFLRQWKSDVMNDFCKYDASSVEEIATNARNRGIDEFAKSLKRDYVNFDMLYILQNNDFLTGNKSLKSYKNMIDELAEEMKGGGK